MPALRLFRCVMNSSRFFELQRRKKSREEGILEHRRVDEGRFILARWSPSMNMTWTIRGAVGEPATE